MSATTCVLCDKIRECLTMEIDATEYDICQDCRDHLKERLKGKGRSIRRDVVILSQPREPAQLPEVEPFPGLPPRIWLSAGREKLNGI